MDKKRFILIIVIVLIVIGIGIAYSVYAPRFRIAYDVLFHDWRDDTHPLDKETQKYLCELFDASEENKCKPDVEAYSFDFRENLRDYIDEGNLQTNEEWDRLFGHYKTDCKFSHLNVLDDGRSYYSCRYDFSGDGIGSVLVWFIEDGTFDSYLYGGGGS